MMLAAYMFGLSESGPPYFPRIVVQLAFLSVGESPSRFVVVCSDVRMLIVVMMGKWVLIIVRVWGRV